MVTALSDYAGGSEHEGIRPLGNLSLNLNSYRVAVGQDVIGLTYHELELLRVFFDQYDRVIPYKEITERVWAHRSGRRCGTLTCWYTGCARRSPRPTPT